MIIMIKPIQLSGGVYEYVVSDVELGSTFRTNSILIFGPDDIDGNNAKASLIIQLI